jgi:hypothetical protein
MVHHEEMTSEPPPEYVAFVSRHLEPLRRDAARVVGDEHDADLLYPDVLTDVATHWGWLELRSRLGQHEAADVYLGRAFARQSQRWTPDLPDSDHFVDDIEIHVWAEDAAPRPVFTSNAVRLAPMVAPKRRAHVGPVCEAAIAWWHAYEVRRRRKLMVIAAIAFVLLLILAQFSAPPI